jgi:hypothetical protein
MAQEKQESWVGKVWPWVKDGWTLFSIISGSGLAIGISRATGANWKTPLPWLWTILAVAGGFAGGRLLKALVFRGWHLIDRPHLFVDTASGQKGSVLLEHSGAPTSYWADGRIVDTLDHSPNPAQQKFQCDLILKNELRGGSVLMRDSQWATIVLGEVKTHHISEQTSLYIRRGRFGDEIVVPDAGVSVEITIRAKPRMKTGPLTKQFRVVREGRQVVVTEEDVLLLP